MTTTLEPPELSIVTLPAPDTTIDAELFYKVLHQVMMDPKSWNQAYWGRKTACGTQHCLAGWTMVMSGNAKRMEWAYDDDLPPEARFSETINEVNDVTTDERAIEDVAGALLGLTTEQAEALFLEFTTAEGLEGLDELWEQVEDITDGEITLAGYAQWIESKVSA